MKLQILGTGCAKCQALTNATEQAAKALGLPHFEIVKVTDIAEISSFGVMLTPALAVDGTVLVSGHVPTPVQLAALITTHTQGLNQGGGAQPPVTP